MKKMLLMCLCFVLIAVATVGGTIAATKDAHGDGLPIQSDSVLVRLSEEQRSADGAGFEPHVPSSVFFPDPGAYPNSPHLTPTLAVPWHDGSELRFWDRLPRAKDKIVSIENTGRTDAYVRTVFAFEDTNGIADRLYLNVTDPDALVFVCRTEIGGTPYKIFTYTYDTPLAAGETSRPSLLQFVFDTSVSSSELAAIGGTYDVLVYAQAVQVDGFSDAASAFDTMFGTVSAENHPWN